MNRHLCTIGAAVVLLLTVGLVAYLTWFQKESITLQPLAIVFEAKTGASCSGQIIINGQPMPYVLNASTDFRSYAFQLPELGEPIIWIRVDPLLTPGEVSLRNIVIAEGSNILRRLDASKMESLNPQAQAVWVGGELRIKRLSSQDYPAFYLTRIYPIRTATDGYPRLTMGGVIGLWMIIGIVVVGLIIKIAKELLKTTWRTRMVWLGVFLAVLGARFLTIRLFGVSFHHFDSWAHEPWNLYFPFIDGNLSWRHLFASCNEHRIFFTRVLSLGVFLINGQWDNLVLASCNNIIYTLAFTGLGFLLWHAAGRRYLGVFASAVTLLAALPFAWENTVWDFQSQFYFCVVFSVLALWLLMNCTPRDPGWYLGIAAAICCLFTVGAGRLPSIVVCCIMVLRLWMNPGQWRVHIATLLAGGFVIGFEYLLPPTPEIWSMRTRTIDQFVETFGKTFSWPFVDNKWMWLLVWLPMACLVFHRFRKRQEVSSLEWLVFAIGGWGFISALGVGLKRGAFSSAPLSRYMDMTSIALLANVAALPALLMRVTPKTRKRMAVIGLVWGIIVTCGLMQVTFDQVGNAAMQKVSFQQQVKSNIITFLREDRLDHILSIQHSKLPDPDPLSTVTYLRSPRVREILPSSVRPPVTVEAEAVSDYAVDGLGRYNRRDVDEVVWGSCGLQQEGLSWGYFQSRPLRKLKLPWLEFNVMGQMAPGLRQKNFYLRLQDMANLREAKVRSIDYKNGTWGTTTMKAPCDTPRIIAMDHDPVFWMAFSEPREKSALSMWTAEVLQYSCYLLVVGVGVMMIALYLMRDLPSADCESAKESFAKGLRA